MGVGGGGGGGGGGVKENGVAVCWKAFPLAMNDEAERPNVGCVIQ